MSAFAQKRTLASVLFGANLGRSFNVYYGAEADNVAPQKVKFTLT